MSNQYQLNTPHSTAIKMAQQMKELRLHNQLKQSTLAQQAGVSLSSLRRFEYSGEISLKSLLLIASSLNCLDKFQDLFQTPPAQTMQELEKASKKKSPPKRGVK